MTVQEGDWEQNMADRAKARADAEYAKRRAKREAQHAALLLRSAELIECAIQREVDELTLEDAEYFRDSSIACACVGPVGVLQSIPDAPCACAVRWQAVQRIFEIHS